MGKKRTSGASRGVSRGFRGIPEDFKLERSGVAGAPRSFMEFQEHSRVVLRTSGGFRE